MNTASRPVTIETERLLLRPFCGEDLKLIKRLYCDERVLRYTPFDTLSAEQAETYQDRLIGCKRAKEGFTALVERGGLEELGGHTAGLEEIMVHLDREARDDG